MDRNDGTWDNQYKTVNFEFSYINMYITIMF